MIDVISERNGEKYVPVSVLGTTYKIKKFLDDDELYNTYGAYTDTSSKEIYIKEKSSDCELNNFKAYQKQCVRHELIHAFLFESGLDECFEHPERGHEETIVDWFAIQAPKIYALFRDLEIIF